MYAIAPMLTVRTETSSGALPFLAAGVGIARREVLRCQTSEFLDLFCTHGVVRPVDAGSHAYVSMVAGWLFRPKNDFVLGPVLTIDYAGSPFVFYGAGFQVRFAGGGSKPARPKPRPSPRSTDEAEWPVTDSNVGI